MLRKRSLAPVVLGSLVCSLLIVGGAAQAATITVPGISNPWLAGWPNGTTAYIGDVAPAQSPVLVGISLIPGGYLQFTNATGTVSNRPIPPEMWTGGPEGDSSFIAGHQVGVENNISNVRAPITALLGIFLDDNVPGSPAPGTLLFETAAERDYLTLSPQLQQVFFIGDGMTSGATVQNVYIPAGATRLFLGVMDGEEWSNNIGSFNVDVNAVPEPATLGLLALGGLAMMMRRRRK